MLEKRPLSLVKSEMKDIASDLRKLVGDVDRLSSELRAFHWITLIASLVGFASIIGIILNHNP